ncbi:MAG TPA: copper resistance protein CopC [Gaiellaceae bacterium]
MKRLVALLLFVALAAPAAATAHATLKSEFPGFQQELQTSPKFVQLHFDQVVQLPVIDVIDIHGVNHALKAVANGTNVRARVRPLPAGAYTIRWHALSSDGHVVSGVWTFGLRVKAPPPTEAYGASGPTGTENLVRWVYFVALATMIGALGFRLLVLRGLEVPPALEKRMLLLAFIGVLGVLEVGIAAFLLRCEDVLQLPFGKFFYGDLSPISGGTRYGKAFIAMTLGFALVSAFVYLAWLLERTLLLAPALVLSLAFTGGLSLSGHDATDPGSSWKSELADWVHISAVSLWIGGLVALVVAVFPAAPGLRREVLARFSRFATVLVALVLAAGTYLAIVRLPAFHDLWRNGYGQVLLVKICLVAVAVAWGGVHKFFPRARVFRSIAGEMAVGLAVLLVAAILTDSKPPPQPVPSSSTSRSAYAGAVGASSWRK